MTTAQSEDWVHRFQELSNQTTERSMESVANVQRLLLAVSSAQLTPDALAAALPRYGHEEGAEVYERLARLIATFLAGLQRILVRCSDEYLTSVVPSGPLRSLGPRAVAPPPPHHADRAEWTVWYQLFGARAAEQQAWLTRLYKIMLDEVAAGRLAPEEVQGAATGFIRERSPQYLTEIAELTSSFLEAALEIADDSVDGLFAELFGEGPSDELVIEATGEPGSTFTRALAVENEQAEPVVVSCTVTPEVGFELVADPADFELAAGASCTVVLRATLAGQATNGFVPAGSVVVHRVGGSDLRVRVDAFVADPLG